MKLSELRNALLKQYYVDWQMNPKKGMHVDAHYANGFDAGAKAVMERAAELVKHINCDVELHARVGIEYCEPCKAIANWTKFKEGNDEAE